MKHAQIPQHIISHVCDTPLSSLRQRRRERKIKISLSSLAQIVYLQPAWDTQTLYIFIYYPTETSQCCLFMHGSGVIQWNVGKLPMTSVPKKIILLLQVAIICIAPQLQVGSHDLVFFHTDILSVQVLQKPFLVSRAKINSFPLQLCPMTCGYNSFSQYLLIPKIGRERSLTQIILAKLKFV